MEPILKYNHEDDTYELVRAESGFSDGSPDYNNEVVRVERILGEREERKESNAHRFLSELQAKKHRVILDKILTTREGPKIMSSQREKLL